MQLALVLWHGHVGGAETFTAALAARLRDQGVDARVVFAGHPGFLAQRLDADGVPFSALDLDRGYEVMLHPRTFARQVAENGADGAILVSGGYMAAGLRLGGYRAELVAVEHGSLLHEALMPLGLRLVRKIDRASGTPALDVLVAPTEHVRERCLRHSHPSRVVAIHHGVDLDRYSPGSPARPVDDPSCVIGAAGRLIRGKGFLELLRALAVLPSDRVRLRIAGEGPLRTTIEAEATAIGDRVEMTGLVPDMPAFWRTTDLAVVPSSTLEESFGMVAVEAMACGLPVVAARSGGLAEVVTEGETGLLFTPGDYADLARCLRAYVEDPDMRRDHGRRARTRAERLFDLERCAAAYRGLFRGSAGYSGSSSLEGRGEAGGI